MMRFVAATSVAIAFLSGFETVLAASWGYKDATISVQSKGDGVGGGSKETCECPLQDHHRLTDLGLG